MKKSGLLLLIFVTNFLHPQDVNNLYADLANLLIPGMRPISRGTEYYVRTQGTLVTTSQTTDYSIFGRGFFVLFDKSRNRLVLTRNGSFLYDNNGYLINHDNYFVLSLKTDLRKGSFVFMHSEDLKRGEKTQGLKYYKTLEDWKKQESMIQQHSFLLIEPLSMETVQIMNSEYLECPDDYLVFSNSSVVPETLELMPIALQELMQDVLRHFKKSNEITYDCKNDLLFLIKERYDAVIQYISNETELLALTNLYTELQDEVDRTF
jgi:hypothetical protein